MDSNFHGNDKSGGGNNRGEVEIVACEGMTYEKSGITERVG